MIGNRQGYLPQPPNNLINLRRRVQEAWDDIPQDTIINLISTTSYGVQRNCGGPFTK